MKSRRPSVAAVASLAVIALAMLAAAPPAQAHGSINASEIERLALADEGFEGYEAQGGWDVIDVYVGEAHYAAFGDGLYLRLFLSGVPRMLGDLSATIDVTAGSTVTRTITWGSDLTSDFELLEAETSDEGVAVQRAFIPYSAFGGRPAQLTDLRIVTFEGDQERDYAPGGLAAGPLELPAGDSSSRLPLPLEGPVRYVSVTASLDDGDLVLHVKNLLKQGSQHAHVRLPGGLEAEPAAAELKPGAAADFTMPLPAAGTSFDVTTDIGGRVGLSIVASDGATQLVAENGTTLATFPSGETAKESPIPWSAAPLAIAALALLRRRSL